MAEDADGLPQVGRSARKLGVRTPADVAVGVDPDVSASAPGDVITPAGGGLSTAPDTPMNLIPLRRPRSMGGKSNDPVWEIDVADLGSDLAISQDKPTHVLIVPARPMSLAEYERALALIRDRWTKVVA